MAAKSFREDPRRKMHEKLTQRPRPQIFTAPVAPKEAIDTKAVKTVKKEEK